MVGIVVLIVTIVMAVWIYQVVDRHGGKLPWLWAIGALVLWPLLATIAGFKYDETAIAVVGMTGLFLIVLGIGLSALL
jgi:hypothetical protein